MDLTTPVHIESYPFAIRPDMALLSLGSCFSEHVGGSLERAHFNCLVNPFGVLFNPLSMALCLDRLAGNKSLETADLFFHGGLYHSPFHHGSFSAPTPEKVLENARKPFADAALQMGRLDVLMLTFGTAWVYERKTDLLPVANCHKLPSECFRRRLLDVEEIVDRYKILIDRLIAVRPDLKVLFQVSPVRHLGDGLHGNQLSKSVLHVSVAKLQELYPGNAFYFPSYEIVMDELRDYRFYDEDMAHPSPLARQVVWERFQESFMDDATHRFLGEVEQLGRLLSHRLLHPSADRIDAHMDVIRKKAAQISCLCPNIDFSKEIESCLIRLQSSLRS